MLKEFTHISLDVDVVLSINFNISCAEKVFLLTFCPTAHRKCVNMFMITACILYSYVFVRSV